MKRAKITERQKFANEVARRTYGHPPTIRARTEVCPCCGNWCRYLHQITGFCQACTYENRRGGPVNPHDHMRTG